MSRDYSLYTLVLASLLGLSAAAHGNDAPQVCTLGAAAAGAQGTIVCKDAKTGATTQSIALGNTTVGQGGTGGTLSHLGDTVLVTNQTYGALVFKLHGGRLSERYALDTHGAATFSGAVSEKGNYVATASQISFYPGNRGAAQGSERLILGDGSVSQVTITRDYAYVAEKNGTLEAFPLHRDGSFSGPGRNVSGIPAGTIVGITSLQDLAIAPVAHLAVNANQAAISVVSDTEQIQPVQTKEVAACWAANDGQEACISNPGSMTISCGQFSSGGFRSYTSAAASAPGEALLDIDMNSQFVVATGTDHGAAVISTFSRSGDNGDFLTFFSEIPAGVTVTTGALLLPPL